MHKLLILLISLSLFTAVTTTRAGVQNNSNADSLIGQMSNMHDDIDKVNTLLKISRLLTPQNNSIYYAKEAEKLAINLDYIEGIVNSLLLQTRGYTQNGYLDSARHKIDTSLFYLKADTSFPELLAKTNFYAGNVYSESNDFNEAATYTN